MIFNALMYYQRNSLQKRHGGWARAGLRISPEPDDTVVMFREKLKRRRLHKDSKKAGVTPVVDNSSGGGAATEMPFLEKTRSKSILRTKELKSPPESKAAANMEDVKSELAQKVKLAGDSLDYATHRANLVKTERDVAWDAPARSRASPAELRAQEIVIGLRERERVDPELFGNMPGEAVPSPDTREMGGRFLVNLPRIKASKVFEIASQVPKGCHQHLHFNSEIPPEYLFPSARSLKMQETMFIRSIRPLLTDEDFAETEIVFNVFPKDTTKADIFSETYNPDWRDKSNSPWMLWADFRKRFPSHVKPTEEVAGLDSAENWAREKMIVSIDHAYGATQGHNSAWACFNQGTRAFKGLLGYESIYRWYIGNMIDNMIRDKVMYAELRPMLLDKTIPSDDGLRHLDHREQMNIIVEEVSKKQKELEARKELHKFPFGLKIIYCAPRSIARERMTTELEDCLKLKLQFPDLICGFDLVGAEDRPNCIKFYADLLVAFTKTCESLGISIPFMFHAGETLLDTGGSQDPENSNLYDSLLLNAKRIGHGYALLKHPVLTERYKKQGICLELCPISNELLRLCGNAREHPFPELLAAGLHCTLNADNPSLFSSSLSYEFYQVMVGDPRMSLHGWKQLAEWSIEHSCLSASEIEEAKKIHADAWEAFCRWVVERFGDDVGGGSPMDLAA